MVLLQGRGTVGGLNLPQIIYTQVAAFRPNYIAASSFSQVNFTWTPSASNSIITESRSNFSSRADNNCGRRIITFDAGADQITIEFDEGDGVERAMGPAYTAATAFTFNISTAYVIEILHRGSIDEVYVDGVLVSTVEDGRNDISHFIGMGASVSQAEITNYEIRGIDEPELAWLSSQAPKFIKLGSPSHPVLQGGESGLSDRWLFFNVIDLQGKISSPTKRYGVIVSTDHTSPGLIQVAYADDPYLAELTTFTTVISGSGIGGGSLETPRVVWNSGNSEFELWTHLNNWPSSGQQTSRVYTSTDFENWTYQNDWITNNNLPSASQVNHNGYFTPLTTTSDERLGGQSLRGTSTGRAASSAPGGDRGAIDYNIVTRESTAGSLQAVEEVVVARWLESKPYIRSAASAGGYWDAGNGDIFYFGSELEYRDTDWVNIRQTPIIKKTTTDLTTYSRRKEYPIGSAGQYTWESVYMTVTGLHVGSEKIFLYYSAIDSQIGFGQSSSGVSRLGMATAPIPGVSQTTETLWTPNSNLSGKTLAEYNFTDNSTMLFGDGSNPANPTQINDLSSNSNNLTSATGQTPANHDGTKLTLAGACTANPNTAHSGYDLTSAINVQAFLLFYSITPTGGRSEHALIGSNAGSSPNIWLVGQGTGIGGEYAISFDGDTDPQGRFSITLLDVLYGPGENVAYPPGFEGKLFENTINGIYGEITTEGSDTGRLFNTVFYDLNASIEPRLGFRGDVYYLMLFNAPLTTAEKDAAEGYAAHRIDLTSRIRPGHPWRARPPVV